ncbi:MAG: DAK2 domain-containing protein [Anaerolineales bacterium]
MNDDTTEPSSYHINGAYFKELIKAALTWLRTNQETVNALNVFPVPDGDTGTNMVLTMQAAYDEISTLRESNVGVLAGHLAHGALMGARGNSGVILSQIWRGFSKAIDKAEVLDAQNLVKGLVQAKETAYKGVVRPVEGTILTVSKDTANAAKKALEDTNNPLRILEIVKDAAHESVERTPELLDVLKEAGVVDAGGKGLFYIYEGMVRYMHEEPLDVEPVRVQSLSAIGQEEARIAAEPGQDYEVIVDFRPHQPLELSTFYDRLEEIGTSIQVGEGDGLYRMHIHVPSDKRYDPIEYTMSLGTVSKVHIENLMEQVNGAETMEDEEDIKLPPVEPGDIAVVAVSPGIGFSRIFASLGANAIIKGGQTMNPSTQEILDAFENLPTNKVIILPNNKNILMAAESAAEMTVKDAKVIPTKTLPEGLAAMLRLMPEQELSHVVEEMKSAIEEVITGEITTAVRSVEIHGQQVSEGEIIALYDDRLITSSQNLEEGCLRFLEEADADAYELITMYYGENLSKQKALEIADVIREKYPDQIVELQYGGQPHYQFILSVE